MFSFPFLESFVEPYQMSFPVGIVPRVESEICDFDLVREDKFVGFAIKACAGFGGWGGDVDRFSIWNLQEDTR
jgi:hypothetical protein